MFLFNEVIKIFRGREIGIEIPKNGFINIFINLGSFNYFYGTKELITNIINKY